MCQRPPGKTIILDLVLSNDELSLLDVKVCGKFTDLCDHNVVEFVLCDVDAQKCGVTGFKDFKKADYYGIGNFLSSVNWEALFENCTSGN